MQVEEKLQAIPEISAARVAFTFSKSELVHYDTEKLPKEAER
jgi:hypothetical protein